jgi:adenine-specific DNA-methyltransferase
MEGLPPSTLWVDLEVTGHNRQAKYELLKLMPEDVFDTPKPVKLIKYIIRLVRENRDAVIMDFFSGSGTTADAVMQMNAEDNGNRKFIMVQLPEDLDEGLSQAANDKKRALQNAIKFCDENGVPHVLSEIARERIYRAGKTIREESPLTTGELDTGFRVFRVDSSNMKDVYYRPKDFKQGQMNLFADNIKEDRTPEDLLFQVMLDLGVLLSSKIEETVIAGKKVFSVADGYLIACFDKDVTEETVKAIAQQHPFYAVFRDSGMATDSVMTNFEQIFETYSPKTVRRVL